MTPRKQWVYPGMEWYTRELRDYARESRDDTRVSSHTLVVVVINQFINIRLSLRRSSVDVVAGDYTIHAFAAATPRSSLVNTEHGYVQSKHRLAKPPKLPSGASLESSCSDHRRRFSQSVSIGTFRISSRSRASRDLKRGSLWPVLVDTTRKILEGGGYEISTRFFGGEFWIDRRNSGRIWMYLIGLSDLELISALCGGDGNVKERCLGFWLKVMQSYRGLRIL